MYADTSGQVPDSGCLVLGRGDCMPLVGADAGCVDATAVHAAGVPVPSALQLMPQLLGGQVPDSHGAVK